MVCGGSARRKAGESDRGEREGEENERESVCVRERALVRGIGKSKDSPVDL